MDTGLLHGHVAICAAYLVFYLVKYVLLLTNNKATLDLIRNKKWIEPVFGTLILASGGYLLATSPVVQPYQYLKLGLVLASIGLGVVAMKRGNKALATVTLVLLVYVYGMAETRNFYPAPVSYASLVPSESLPAQQVAATIYAQECVRCHGTDGALGRFKAMNIKGTALSKQAIMDVITNGRNSMKAYGKRLSPEQIDALADYVQTLK